MVFPNFLGIKFNWSTPDHSVPKISNHIPVYLITEVLHSTPDSLNDDRLFIIRVFALGLSVDSNQIEILPHSVNKFVQIPPQISGNRHIVLDLVQNVQFIERYGINFIQSIQARDVLAIALNYVNYVVLGGITFEQNVSVVDSVFLQNGFYRLVAYSVSLDHSRNGHPTFILPFEINLRRPFVQPNPKSL